MTANITSGGTKRKEPSLNETPTFANTGSTIELSSTILHNRLLTGLGNKGGARGSLTKCVERLEAYLADVDYGAIDQQAESNPPGPNNNSPPAPSAKEDPILAEDGALSPSMPSSLSLLLRELKHQHLEMYKLVLLRERLGREIQSVKERTDARKAETVASNEVVQQKRRQLQQQLTVTACEREYEALAKLVVNRHPVGQRRLRNELDKLNEDIALAKAQLNQARAESAIRKGQFQLLVQCILDLKQSLQEPLDTTGNGIAIEEESEPPTADTSMEVDESEAKISTGSDSQDLYDDL